ncbi:MAG: metallophosphoesterase [Candidatus Omnitrophica bacterium]|nr:metallophosphoesterase [Candidatus Omnitrophota bacterium]
MKIGVVSDTHSRSLPKQLIDELKNVELIVHAGDFCSAEDLRMLKKINEVRAVFGNMDDLELRRMLPESDVFEMGGVKIGLCHGKGSPAASLEFVKNRFKNDKVDVVIYGHSHKSFNEVMDNVLYFNPGSPTDKIRGPHCSYGILEINKGKVSGKIIKIKDQNG